MPLAVDFYSSTSTAVAAEGSNQLYSPQRKKSRRSLDETSQQVNQQSDSYNRSRQFTSYILHRQRTRRYHRSLTQSSPTVSAGSAAMQGYRAQPSFVVDFEQTNAQAAQTQAFTPYALPVCYAPVCCAPPMTTAAHVPVNRWAAFPAGPCTCTSGLQVLTSCDGVACTASHGSMPFIHFHGVSVPYHCPHFHTHRMPPPTQPPVAAVPVSFASSVYQPSSLQPGVYHQQQHQHQHRLQAQAQSGYHSTHQLPPPQQQQQQQQQTSYHGHQSTHMPAYHGHQVSAQQNASYHGHQQAPPQQQNGYHGHQMTQSTSVYHQQAHYVQHAHQMSDDMVAETGIQLPQSASSAVHQPMQQQSQQHSHLHAAASVAAAATGQPLQHGMPTVGQATQLPHGGTVNVPPSWLLPLSSNEFLAAQVPQYRPATSARQRWRTYPPVATPYSGYLLHFLAMLGRPTVMSAALPHHRVGLQNEDFADLDSYEALLSLAERLGDAKSRGLSKPEIEKLPCYRYENLPEEQSARLDQTSCVVCLCDFEPRQMVRILPCRHEFHTRCVDKWLKTNRTCPLCRADVTETAKMDVE